MSARSGRGALRAAGVACIALGAWLTLVSVGGWVLERALPPGLVPALARALVIVSADLASRAWPLAVVALGVGLLVGTPRAERARREEARG